MIADTEMARENGRVCITCRSCKKAHRIKVSEDAIRVWREGMFIQEAMPELTPAERELLMSGICGDCFLDLFPHDD